MKERGRTRASVVREVRRRVPEGSEGKEGESRTQRRERKRKYLRR